MLGKKVVCWMLMLTQALAVIVISAALAWHTLAKVDFMYPLWHELLNISHTVSQYGPRNRFKKDFAQTDAKEHARLFSAIVISIENNGEGLEAIQYKNKQGEVIDYLLRPRRLYI